jgi:hypothetical protein
MATKSGKTAKPQIQLALPLDEQKIAAIQKCLKKGTLTIKVASVDVLKGARGADGYTYD